MVTETNPLVSAITSPRALYGLHGDKNLVIGIVKIEFAARQFLFDKTMQKGGGSKHVAVGGHLHVGVTKGAGEEAPGGAGGIAPPISAAAQHVSRHSLADSRQRGE